MQYKIDISGPNFAISTGFDVDGRGEVDRKEKTFGDGLRTALVSCLESVHNFEGFRTWQLLAEIVVYFGEDTSSKLSDDLDVAADNFVDAANSVLNAWAEFDKKVEAWSRLTRAATAPFQHV